MATHFAGAYKVATVEKVRVGSAATDYGAIVTLIPDVTVDTQDNNTYIDATTAGVTGWPGAMPVGSLRIGPLTKTIAALWLAGQQCTVTLTY